MTEIFGGAERCQAGIGEGSPAIQHGRLVNK